MKAPVEVAEVSWEDKPCTPRWKRQCVTPVCHIATSVDDEFGVRYIAEGADVSCEGLVHKTIISHNMV